MSVRGWKFSSSVVNIQSEKSITEPRNSNFRSTRGWHLKKASDYDANLHSAGRLYTQRTRNWCVLDLNLHTDSFQLAYTRSHTRSRHTRGYVIIYSYFLYGPLRKVSSLRPGYSNALDRTKRPADTARAGILGDRDRAEQRKQVPRYRDLTEPSKLRQ